MPPQGFDKYHISWSLDNIVCGFEHFRQLHGRYPMSHDLTTCEYLPNVKTLNRKFGSLINIRKQLGIHESDLRVGTHRSNISKKIGERGFNAEQNLYSTLISKFHEPFVHNQSRVVVNKKHLKVDFLVFHKHGKFAVDVFHPESERGHFSTNVSVKYRTYADFPFTFFLVVANEEVGQSQINENTSRAIAHRPDNISLIRMDDFIEQIGKYTPLQDPYTTRDG